MLDGSAKSVKIRELATASAQAQPLEPGQILSPSGDFAGGSSNSEAVMRAYQIGSPQGFTWSFDKPAYFWATRNGVRGVDIP